MGLYRISWLTAAPLLPVSAQCVSLIKEQIDSRACGLAHIWPSHDENVHFYGTYVVGIDGELANSTPTATGRCASRRP